MILNLYLLSNCKSFKCIPNALYCYRKLTGGTNGFSVRAMQDLDTIKKYQLLFLERYQGEEKEQIKEILFAEIANWLFVYVCQGVGILSDKQISDLICEALKLPRFELAKQYYSDKPIPYTVPVDLLRESNADKYIQCAKESAHKRSLKNTIRELLKRLYISI